MDDLTAGIIGFQQATLDSKIQYAVARKMLDNQQIPGCGCGQADRGCGEDGKLRGDQLVAAATGLGGKLTPTRSGGGDSKLTIHNVTTHKEKVNWKWSSSKYAQHILSCDVVSCEFRRS